MVRILPLVLLAVLCLASDLLGNTYTFKLGGKPVEGRITSVVGKPDAPAPGDLVQIDNFQFVLDEPGEYDLIAENQVLRRRRSDGSTAPLAIEIEQDYSDD